MGEGVFINLAVVAPVGMSTKSGMSDLHVVHLKIHTIEK